VNKEKLEPEPLKYSISAFSDITQPRLGSLIPNAAAIMEQSVCLHTQKHPTVQVVQNVKKSNNGKLASLKVGSQWKKRARIMKCS